MTGHTYPCRSGLLADEAVALLKQFYSTENVKGTERLLWLHKWGSRQRQKLLYLSQEMTPFLFLGSERDVFSLLHMVTIVSLGMSRAIQRDGECRYLSAAGSIGT